MSKQTTPVKIFIDARAIATEKVSGIGHNLVETIRALQKLPQATEYQIVLIVPISKRQLIEQWGFMGVRIKTMPLPMRIINRLERYHLMPYVDIFLGRGLYIFPNYSNWPLFCSKSLTYIHDLGYALYPQFVEPSNLKMLKKSIPRWVRRTTRIAAISNSTRLEIINYFKLPPQKVSVIRCGVDTEVFYPRNEEAIKAVQKKYDLPKLYLLYFGNIEPRKNLVNLVRAYSDLPKPIRQAYGLVIAGGDGWLNEDINIAIEYATAHGEQILKVEKYVDDNDLPALYSGAYALIHPSFYEGFGISPLQAMSCGCPVIASRIASIPEVVGEAGIYIDNPNDPKDISTKIKRLINTPELYESCVKKGLNRSKIFSWEKTGKQLLATIESMMNQEGQQ